ncbi:hypothetical protein B0O99DRAFT_674645 [Bisporella sp. PMI_857]|nr:hypothetical protein B0O99DRAFT_674645 [Bisporella sp. PMI_857]
MNSQNDMDEFEAEAELRAGIAAITKAPYHIKLAETAAAVADVCASSGALNSATERVLQAVQDYLQRQNDRRAPQAAQTTQPIPQVNTNVTPVCSGYSPLNILAVAAGSITQAGSVIHDHSRQTLTTPNTGDSTNNSSQFSSVGTPISGRFTSPNTNYSAKTTPQGDTFVNNMASSAATENVDDNQKHVLDVVDNIVDNITTNYTENIIENYSPDVNPSSSASTTPNSSRSSTNSITAKHKPIAPRGTKYLWADNSQYRSLSALPFKFGVPNAALLTVHLKATTGVIYPYHKPLGLKEPNWNDRKFIDRCNGWIHQLIMRHLNNNPDNASSSTKRSPRPQWSMIEHDYLQALIEQAIEKSATGDLSDEDWKAIGEKQNRRFVGRMLAVGQAFYQGRRATEGRKKAWTAVNQKERAFEERTVDALRSAVRGWPETKKMMSDAKAEKTKELLSAANDDDGDGVGANFTAQGVKRSLAPSPASPFMEGVRAHGMKRKWPDSEVTGASDEDVDASDLAENATAKRNKTGRQSPPASPLTEGIQTHSTKYKLAEDEEASSNDDTIEFDEQSEETSERSKIGGRSKNLT